MNTEDPVRWLDDAATPLSADGREALASYAREGPSAEQHARIWSALEPTTVAASPRLPPKRRAWWWSGVAGLAAVALWWNGPAVPAPAMPIAAGSAPPWQQVIAAPVAAPAAAPVTASTPLPSQRDTPRPTPVPGRSGSPRRAQPNSDAGPAPNSGAELALLSPARQVLATAPARTLALADEHARRFPRGVFAEERAFLRIEALLRLGRTEQASSDAGRFRRQYPRSSYRERLHQLLLPAR